MKIPGLVDLQVNGFKGVDFSSADLTEERFITTCRMLLNSGTTWFLPTIISCNEKVYKQNLPLMAKVITMPEFDGTLLGIHVEGPFLSTESGTYGVHNPDYIRKPDIEFLVKLIDWANGKIKILTIAAEVDGADEITRYAVSHGITVSLGHQMALEEDLDRAVKAGATALTHLGNGIPGTIPRHLNPIWAGLSNDDLTAMIITDGHHLPVSVLKSMIRAKGISRLIVVSDVSPLAGMPPGHYNYLGEDVILEENGLLHNVQRGCLAGSSSTIIDCMNHLASLNILSPDELLHAGYYNPLRLIGVDPESLKSNRDILFDEEKQVFTV